MNLCPKCKSSAHKQFIDSEQVKEFQYENKILKYTYTIDVFVCDLCSARWTFSETEDYKIEKAKKQSIHEATLKRLFQETEIFVEANDYEIKCSLKEVFAILLKLGARPEQLWARVYPVTNMRVNADEQYPINIEVHFYKLLETNVLFWQATSNLIDKNKIFSFVASQCGKRIKDYNNLVNVRESNMTKWYNSQKFVNFSIDDIKISYEDASPLDIKTTVLESFCNGFFDSRKRTEIVQKMKNIETGDKLCLNYRHL